METRLRKPKITAEISLQLTTLQLYLFYIFTIKYFCSNISTFTLYGCVMDVLILLNIVCTVRKCLESKPLGFRVRL